MLSIRVVAILVAISARSLGFSVTDSGVFVTTQVASLVDGHLRVPNSTRELLVEIGCSDFNTLDETLLEKRQGAYLVAFEPMMDKYAVLLSRGSQRMIDPSMPPPGGRHIKRLGQDQAIPLGQHHPRGVVLPLAVSQQGGPAPMRITKVAGCSSLSAPSGHANAGGFLKHAPRIRDGCMNVLETRMVDSITMAQALSLLPPALPIHLLKIDAQGQDAALLRLTPERMLARVQRIEFESFSGSSRCAGQGLYSGQEPCESILPWLAARGFEAERGCKVRGGCEVNVIVSRTPATAPGVPSWGLNVRGKRGGMSQTRREKKAEKVASEAGEQPPASYTLNVRGKRGGMASMHETRDHGGNVKHSVVQAEQDLNHDLN